MTQSLLTFSENEIQRLFGDEAADFEDISRLREYYVKTSVYDHFTTDLALRILVGHKGIGKSALFRIAMSEDNDKHRLSILIKPDDIAEIGGDTSNFLQLIRQWKNGLSEIIARKVLTSFGKDDDTIAGKAQRLGGNILELLRSTFHNSEHLQLDSAKRLVVERFLESRIINIYIDDLDRGWQGRREDIVKISALLNAVRDIVAENSGIRFRISLRSDVYYLVRTADESTDKIEGSVLWQAWTNHEIFVLLVKRIETFFGRTIQDSQLMKYDQHQLATYLDSIFEEKFRGMGKWENAPIHRVLMSLIRKRPRDLVKLCTLAARVARDYQSSKIMTEHLKAVFEEYSQGRIQDTINEFRSELPQIERLILNMKPSRKSRTAEESYLFSNDELIRKIKRIAEQGEFQFANYRVATPKQLAAFLYKINFLTARRDNDDKIIRYYFEENRYLSSEIADFGYHWEVHPAYRWALQPDDPKAIYKSVDLIEK